MRPGIDWESRIGRRLRLRDLHVLSAVVQQGSMAKAAAQLGVTQPSISEVIGDLEHALGVRLLDRSRRGVEATLYARALLERSHIVFDELRQAVRDIESLADPAVGQVRIGCPESITSSILPGIILRFAERHPRVALEVASGPTVAMIAKLLARELDFVVARGGETLADAGVLDQLDIEVLFNDRLVVVAGKRSKWSARRRIGLGELVAERWVLSGPGTWNHTVAAQAFRAQRLELPVFSVSTLSVHLRANLVASESCLTMFPYSVLQLYGDRFGLKMLPVDLPPRPWPVTLVTLKNRTLSPAVARLVQSAREVAKSFAAPRRG